MKFPVKFLGLLSLFIILFSTALTADITRKEKDKMVFGNGGGFEDQGTHVEVLDIGTEAEYFSKGLYIDEELILIDERVEAREQINDFIIFSTDTNNTHNIDEVGGDPLEDTWNLLVGDFQDKYMVINSKDIKVYVVDDDATPNIVHTEGYLFVNYHQAATFMGNVNGEYLEDYIPGVSVYRILVSNNEELEVNRVGIWTDNPVEELTISGDFKVEGEFDVVVGVFAPESDSENTQDVSGTTSDFQKILWDTIDVQYVSHNAFIIGSVTMHTDTTGEARLRIKKYVDGSPTDYIPASNISVTESSRVAFKATGAEDTYTYTPMWSGTLSPDGTDSTTPVTYEVWLEIDFDESDGEYTATGYQEHLMILALPNAEKGLADLGDIGKGAQFEVTTEFDEDDDGGDFFTENTLSFENGSQFIDTSAGLNLRSGSSFTPIYASVVQAPTITEYSTLLMENVTENEYSLHVGKDQNDSNADNYIGFTTNFYTDTAISSGEENPSSYNVQAINDGLPSTLNLGITNFSEGSLIVDDGSVGIGGSPQGALYVDGDALFSGQYLGEYGLTDYVSFQGNYGSGGSSTLLINTTDELVGTLTIDLTNEDLDYNVMFFGSVLAAAKYDRYGAITFDTDPANTQLYFYLEIVDNGGAGSVVSTSENFAYASDSNNNFTSIFITYSDVLAAGDTYEVSLYGSVEVDADEGAGGTQPDEFYLSDGTTNSTGKSDYEQHGTAALGYMAIPSGD